MTDRSLEPEETEHLLNKAREGDRDSLELLFTRHRDFLRRFVELRMDPRLRSRLDPSDVVQEAHAEAARRLPDYLADPRLPFRLWLRQLALDRTLKARRTHVTAARRGIDREIRFADRSSLVLARQLLGQSSPSVNLSRRELARRVQGAVEQLGDNDREVLLLRYYEGLSNQEIGILLELDPATVSKRHGRAILRLHKLLFDDGLTESQQ